MCIDHIVLNFDNLISCVDGGYTWRYAPYKLLICEETAQKLVSDLCRSKRLDKDNLDLLCIFHLTSINLYELNINKQSLAFLKHSNLRAIKLRKTNKIDISSLISYLNETSLKNLSYLNVRKSALIGNISPLGKLENLRVLDISKTNLGDKHLNMIAKSLPELKYLNISENRIKDIKCLIQLKESLTHLIMNNMNEHRNVVPTFCETIIDLEEIRVLDISIDEHRSYITDLNPSASAGELCYGNKLPNLTYLYISGNPLHLNSTDIRLVC